MKILFFDTETIGLPDNYKAPYTDTDNWPRMLQIAWTVEEDGKVLDEVEFIVYPDEFEIPKLITDLTRISTERAKEDGVGLDWILQCFGEAVDDVDKVVAHNYNFDYNILGAEYVRMGWDFPLKGFSNQDTMLTTTELCKLPAKWGYKWPKLQELHITLFGEEFEEAHDALADIKAMSKCYWELERTCELRVIKGKNQYVRLTTKDK